jgi:hypothetical protein
MLPEPIEIKDEIKRMMEVMDEKAGCMVREQASELHIQGS